MVDLRVVNDRDVNLIENVFPYYTDFWLGGVNQAACRMVVEITLVVF